MSAKEELSGAEIVVRCLQEEGVEHVFGYPGGAVLYIYDALFNQDKVKHVLVRHEQGAVHAADAYARCSDKVGVCLVTSGPGVTNAVTGIATAYLDSIPMVVLTGQVPTHAIGMDAFQECDTVGITRSVTKHNELVMSAQDLPRIIAEAFHIATTGRPGPVLVDVPKDVLQATMDWYWPDTIDLVGYRVQMTPDAVSVRRAAELILNAERPVLYVGGGVLKSRGAAALLELAELCDIHVVTTLMARGAFSDDHRLALGMPGMHGNYTAVTAMQRSDLLINLGARFDDRVTGKVAGFAPDAKIIHADIDPAEHGKVRRPDVALVGDCRITIEELVRAIRDLMAGGATFADRAAWKQTISGWRENFPLTYDQPLAGDSLKPQMVMEHLRDSVPHDTILVSGVGQHQMWASQYWKFRHPYTWVNSGGLGTMGFAVPAAIGAKVGCPDKMVWAVDGDGCFQMTNQELTTAAIERIPVKVAILNNSYLGMVRQWQEMFYDERYSEVYLSPELPDFVKLAEAMGCVGIRVDSPEEIQPAIDKANDINDRPVVVDFRTDEAEKVFPMVAAGLSNDQVEVHPSQRERLARERAK